jgi:hypothetical protein
MGAGQWDLGGSVIPGRFASAQSAHSRRVELTGDLPDFRPHFPNYVRDLVPELARIAVFVVAIGRGPEVDGRKPEVTVVGGCEGDRCAIGARAAT